MEAEHSNILSGTTTSEASDGHRKMSLFLNFRDPELETGYLQAMDKERRRSVNGSLVLGIFLLFALSIFDATFVPKSSLARFEQVRFYIWVPSLVVGLLGNLRIKDARYSIRWITALSVVTVFSLAALTRIAGVASVEYLQLFTFQILLYVFFMVGLPFRNASLVSVATCLVQAGTLISLDLGSAKLGSVNAGGPPERRRRGRAFTRGRTDPSWFLRRCGSP